MGLNLKNLGILFLALALTILWIRAGSASDDARFPMPAQKIYVTECGGCHTAYAPGLLPTRSWIRMMGELENHFGEDASLDEPDRLAIQRHLTDWSADSRGASLLMRRIAGAIPAGATPQRITETWFFGYMHDEVPTHIWKRKKVGTRANCIACHPRANEGSYAEREVVIPRD